MVGLGGVSSKLGWTFNEVETPLFPYSEYWTRLKRVRKIKRKYKVTPHPVNCVKW